MRRPAEVDAAAHVIVDELPDELVLTDDTGHHLARVRRLRVGEHVTAADGRGTWREYAVLDVSDGTLRLGETGAAVSEAPSEVSLTLAFAPAKGDRPERVVRAVTELGVDAIVPVFTERSVVRWRQPDAAAARLARVIHEAAGQSRRARLPELRPACELEALAAFPGLVVADRTGVAAAELARPSGGEWIVLVGPEGGLSPTERDALVHAPRVALGPHVLRAETAAIAAVVALRGRKAS